MNELAMDAADLYIDLLKKCLTRSVFPEKYATLPPTGHSWPRRAVHAANWVLRGARLELVRPVVVDTASRAQGLDRPQEAETMIGDVRLASLHTCIVDVLESGVPGDLLEAGVWRGGASILMRGILKAHRSDRTVWVADSFAGLPPPTPSLYPADEGDEHWRNASLAVSLDEVKRNFDKYGLLDDQVKFLVGWFHETLASAPIEQLAILRLDGDMYQSTMDGLRNLYPLLAPGGYLIVDDYGAIPACKQAVLDYRKEFDITEEIVPIDWTGILWQRRQ